MADLTERAKAYLDGWRDEDGHALISELVDRIDELERENAKFLATLRRDDDEFAELYNRITKLRRVLREIEVAPATRAELRRMAGRALEADQ